MNAFQVIFQTLASNYFVKHLSAVASLFLRSQHFKAPTTKHPSMRIPLLVNLFLPNTPNRELEHIVLLKREGGGYFFLLHLILGPFLLMQNEGRFFISEISVFSTHYKMQVTIKCL